MEAATVETVNGKFTNTPFIGTLANDGVGLAPYHDFESKVPAELNTKIEELKAADHRRHHQGRVDQLAAGWLTHPNARRSPPRSGVGGFVVPGRIAANRRALSRSPAVPDR